MWSPTPWKRTFTAVMKKMAIAILVGSNTLYTLEIRKRLKLQISVSQQYVRAVLAQMPEEVVPQSFVRLA